METEEEKKEGNPSTERENAKRFKQSLIDRGFLPPKSEGQAKEISESRGVTYKDPWQN